MPCWTAASFAKAPSLSDGSHVGRHESEGAIILELILLVTGIFLVNLPFGYWREGVRKFSPAWFVAVHAPVPLVILMRLAAGISWSLSLVPALVVAYFFGQWVGAMARRRATAR